MPLVVLPPELERCPRGLHKKPNLTFDILTDLHLKTTEQLGLVSTRPDYSRNLDGHGAADCLDADAVREQKVQVFHSMRPVNVEEVARRTMRGQLVSLQLNT